jgi:uncharacterized RDD family membrane protein YckC
MLLGYEFVDAETRIRVIPPNEILSVAPPEGRWYLPRRFLAFVIDGIVQNVVVIAAYLGAGILLVFILGWAGYPSSVLPDDLGSGDLTIYLFTFFSALLTHVICESLSGKTVGKKLTGLIVVMRDGTPCTLRGALIRFLASFIDLLFLGLVGLSKMQGDPWKRRYGDVWGKTVVLSSNQVECQPGGVRTSFLAAFFLAVLSQGFLASLWLAYRILS